MKEVSFELAIGDSLIVGDRRLTVVDIEDGDVTFRIDRLDEFDNYDSYEDSLETNAWETVASRPR